MTRGKSKKQKDRLNRQYTHPEFLNEFFPNIDPTTIEEDFEVTLTENQFFDVLEKVTKPVNTETRKD